MQAGWENKSGELAIAHPAWKATAMIDRSTKQITLNQLGNRIPGYALWSQYVMARYDAPQWMWERR